MGDILVPGQKIQIPSPVFNFLVVINDSSSNLDITPLHTDIVIPMIIIKDTIKKEGTEEDKAIKEQLKNLEGVEAGK